MKKRNVTIVIDEDLHRRVRVWAAQRNTTLSTVVRVLLETVPSMPRADQRFPVAGQAPASSPPAPQPPPAAASAPPAPTPLPPANSENPL
ncbi:MAG TPA: hypothetical protein VND90_13200 [Terracidiphilus sp.]|nr:hypothetical protein [Terracidiphilus sp.]